MPINRQHARNIAELYSTQGYAAVSIDCDTPKEERELLIRNFKEGSIQVLVNVELFTEGFDCPDVSFIQLARPTRSLAIYLQQVGRGLRYAEGKEKTIFIDNVGLYNYFGLPDANRKWEHHFLGRDVPEEMKYGRRSKMSFDIPERTYDEENEELMVVRGCGNYDKLNLENENPQDEKFDLCEYYQVSGNCHRFTVHTLVKRKGKPTGEISSLAYSYDKSEGAISLSSDETKNTALMNCNPKLKSVLIFSASMCGITQSELFKLEGVSTKEEISPFNLLKILATIYNMNKVGTEK